MKKYRDYVEVAFSAQAGMALATLAGSIVLVAVLSAAVVGCSLSAGATGLATTALDVE